jgi:5,10-methylenetetrahydromethanopterin reductase
MNGPDLFDLSSVFSTVADAVPDREILVWRERRLTYREVDRRIGALAAYLRTAGLGPADLAGITAAGPALLQSGWTGPASSINSRIEQARQAGITEIIYAPTGPDICREVLAFLDAAR